MAFLIVGRDAPIFEFDMSNKREEVARSSQYILHAALDMVDAHLRTPAQTNTYLKVIDRHGEIMVSAYVTPGGLSLLLLHSHAHSYAPSEENVKSFFVEVHELYIKALLNPFYTPYSRLDGSTCREFDARVRAAARKHLSYRGE